LDGPKFAQKRLALAPQSEDYTGISEGDFSHGGTREKVKSKKNGPMGAISNILEVVAQ